MSKNMACYETPPLKPKQKRVHKNAHGSRAHPSPHKLAGKSALSQAQISGAEDLIPVRPFNELIESCDTQLAHAGTATAKVFATKYPAAYAACVHYLSAGMPIAHVQSLLRISEQTVQAVMDREAANMPDFKQVMLNKTRFASRFAIEKLIELIPTLTGRDAVIAYGILTDKLLLLSGEANVIINHRHEIPDHNQLNDLIASLPLANAQVVKPVNEKMGNNAEPVALTCD